MTPEQLREWVAASRRAQGLSEFVTDARVLDDVVTLLGSAALAPQARSARSQRRRRQSVAPGDVYAVGVERVASSDGCADGNALDHGSDNGALPVAS